jgi:N-methylhydantoinase A
MMATTEAFRLGIDIGGTFTDAILISERTGRVWSEKVLTTPHDPSEGFMEVVERLIAHSAIDKESIQSLIHATTVATNAVIERTGAVAGLLVTEGFRDILEIARQIRHELYNLQTDKPVPLIPRRYCFEIRERIDHQGTILQELDEQSVESAIRKLRAEGVDSIAICLLHSYRNPTHEQRVAEIAQRLHPKAVISVSSEIAPEIREYWRASTTVMNAYIAPTLTRYVDGIADKLGASEIKSPLYLMQSNGGITSVETAKRRPVYLIESGPAAGVAVAAHFCELTGVENAIAFDMGGTTAKMGLITSGKSAVSSEFEVGAGWSGTPLTRGSGYPILGSVVDLVEVGAGGGSIAWIDRGDVLKVGPRSAGADPGPVCYQKGGSHPTVTDANLVLGRLDPNYFAGGEIKLDKAAAYEAIERECAEPLEMDVLRAAMGIVEIANATMVQAMRLVSIQRGHDPREFALVATGGAGPLHANALANELGIPMVIVPPSPGVASALGMLVSDLRWDFRATKLEALADTRLEEIEEAFTALEKEALALFSKEGVEEKNASLERFAEMRYVGQSWKLRVPLPVVPLSANEREQIKMSFDELHGQTYGYSVATEPVEIVNIGLTAIGRLDKPQLEHVVGKKRPGHARAASREVYFKELDGLSDCEVFDRYVLEAGERIDGPAIIEETDSTIVVCPGYQADVEDRGTVIIRPTTPDRSTAKT